MKSIVTVELHSRSNLTLKCNASTFVKIDARIREKLLADYLLLTSGTLRLVMGDYPFQER